MDKIGKKRHHRTKELSEHTKAFFVSLEETGRRRRRHARARRLLCVVVVVVVVVVFHEEGADVEMSESKCAEKEDVGRFDHLYGEGIPSFLRDEDDDFDASGRRRRRRRRTTSG